MTSTDATRLVRCWHCGGKLKPPPGRRVVGCPMCALTLVNSAGTDRLPPLVVPRFSREACWQALEKEQRLPRTGGATEVREARLLLAPFWRFENEQSKNLSRPGTVVSGADLLSIGLPGLTRSTPRLFGLDVEARTRVGDAMGRLTDDASDIEAEIVDVGLGPDGVSLAEALDASGDTVADWRLFYYPLWSFRYVVYSKEQFHVVDATNARPVGHALRPRWLPVAGWSVGAMLVVFLALQPLAGALAALPAWLAGMATLRASLVRQRRTG